jgi:hypothetical protein
MVLDNKINNSDRDHSPFKNLEIINKLRNSVDLGDIGKDLNLIKT